MGGLKQERRPLGVPAPSDLVGPIAAVGIVIAFILLGVLAVHANHRLLAWDEPVRQAIRGIDAAWFHDLMRWITGLGSRWVILALTVPLVLLARKRCPQLSALFVVALVAGLVLELTLKAVVDRPRPSGGMGFGASFPSGHVLAAVAFWGLLPPWAFLMTGNRTAWAATMVVVTTVLGGVGLTRVALGAHWPSDVVAGYLAGTVFLLAAEWAVRRPWPVLDCEGCDLHPVRGEPSAG